jgi:hypothetical protein
VALPSPSRFARSSWRRAAGRQPPLNNRVTSPRASVASKPSSRGSSVVG